MVSLLSISEQMALKHTHVWARKWQTQANLLTFGYSKSRLGPWLQSAVHIKWQQKDNVPAKSRKHTFIQITHWPCMCCCHITITTYPLVCKYKYANMWMKGFFPFSIREFAFGAVQVKTQIASRNSQPELVRTWKHHRKILQLFFSVRLFSIVMSHVKQKYNSQENIEEWNTFTLMISREAQIEPPWNETRGLPDSPRNSRLLVNH